MGIVGILPLESLIPSPIHIHPLFNFFLQHQSLPLLTDH